ncbi:MULTISPECIES: hypothetical protein [unclassified Corallococcus]|uniref:hypothetical protein n=1 Tax=unclassified Corallococcus TaxID=2685029 RepID=UPI001A8F312A|nr:MULTISPECIES: hypothetical protein [unclassified Corallococcus]MBN9683674.1 hypothetical protein [Corallococcus sp. NCSPR001]WAS89501.1 hypothetical protein O0N60_36830 [Corallococcus sp. NCRR]
MDDEFLFIFKGGFDALADPLSELSPFFDALESEAGDWMPDITKGKRRRGYTRAAVMKALSESRDENSTSVGLYRTTEPKLDMTLLLWFPPLPPALETWLNVKSLVPFTDEGHCRSFVEMVRAWAIRYPVASHAYAHSAADSELSGAPHYGREERLGRKNGFDQIHAVYWLNLFGPKLVDTVGRERMRSTPAHRVEELPDGSILLVTWPTAADFATEAARVAQARAWVHLRPDLDFDTVMATLRERSATLAPVEPRFAPDVAPLLSRLPEYVSLAQRQRRIAELNAYVPPEPDEWLPLDAALPPDVADPKAALDQYASLAERLVALLHTPVPSVLKGSPESLTDIDLHFWKETFPDTFERHNIDAIAVPAVGAYLGEVLVKHLGGQWLPRKQWMEAQVRVGDRVWLPFARAHRYMRSTQALLDHSLTQLYRVAERHARY